ncbi:MAG: hypothetical protein GF388_07600 [Candidatus Aegiribacteria sp.]|nr:hypothetical protein [Candidatus Aegiribacteria sp.]MBD3294989.1 hypothetical protein [Candidatus Fermentibacteria bacterium]
MMKRIAAIAILSSLVLLVGCVEDPTLPDVEGYQGFVDQGWGYYQDGNFQQAYNSFLDAIDADPQKAEAYVGAGWATLYLPDYWIIADDYFYMAIQNQAGYFPLSDFNESQVQDTMWTEFQCMHPDLPPSVLNPILENTADSGIVWVADSINAIVGDDPIPYRFQPLNTGAIAIFSATNTYTTVETDVDSISGGWIYLTVPLSVLEVGGDDYYTWINVDNQMNYEYRVYDNSGSPGGQTFYDALAGTCMLQDIRGENGNPLLGCAAAWALDKINPNYSFGSGMSYEGYESLSNMQLKGTAAALAFAQQYFRFAWFTCLSEGQGASLDPSDPSFVTDLMGIIDTMISS